MLRPLSSEAIFPPGSIARTRASRQSTRTLMQSTATVVLLAATASANKIRVIGAGQGRTGTDSLRVALNMLGFGPTYHMGELLGLTDDLARPVGPGEMLGLVGGHNEKWVEIETVSYTHLTLPTKRIV